jgi:hypothetical protein
MNMPYKIQRIIESAIEKAKVDGVAEDSQEAFRDFIRKRLRGLIKEGVWFIVRGDIFMVLIIVSSLVIYFWNIPRTGYLPGLLDGFFLALLFYILGTEFRPNTKKPSNYKLGKSLTKYYDEEFKGIQICFDDTAKVVKKTAIAINISLICVYILVKIIPHIYN